MKSELSLTYKDKVLLFLRDYIELDNRNELPEDITQKGISEKTGMSRTHASRILKGLKEEGLIEEKLSSVEGHERKLKTYRLKSKGFEESKKLYDTLIDLEIRVVHDQNERDMAISKVLKRHNKNPTLFELLNMLKTKNIPIDINGTEKTISEVNESPEFFEFIDRKRELEELERWFKSDIPVAIILGRRGYGSSTLASSFIKRKNRHTLWIKTTNKSWRTIKDQIKSFLDKLDKNNKENINILERILQEKVFLVFDDYYKVDDDLVDFLSDYLELNRNKMKSKILVTSRKGIPVYERFYKIKDVNNNNVREIDISPFDKDDAQKLLGTQLKDEALDRLMLMTKGSPLLLHLLKEEDREQLNKVSPLSREQISLLFFLKSEEKT